MSRIAGASDGPPGLIRIAREVFRSVSFTPEA
jgi:hypothetical protein